MQSITKKITGYTVNTGQSPDTKGNHDFVDEADRRLKIEGCPVPPTASLRWQRRPELTAGNPGHTYIVKCPEGEFAVFVGHTPNGSPVTGTPFEVWVNGSEAPRGLSELARSLSIDMRSQDRAWLQRKLEALQKTPGEPFELIMPDGNRVNARSAVDAFARLVLFRCQELGAFDVASGEPTPVIDALMSKREPKTTGSGSVCWYADIHNYATGDELVLFLKEADVVDPGRADGATQRRPFSVWLAGDYPESLDGLAKSLSLDMRVSEPAWLARKLRQLIDVREPRGEFMAPMPGATDGKQKSYPSTVAYIAELITFRFKQLGLFNEAGEAAADSGVVQLHQVRLSRKKEQRTQEGLDCDSCGSVASVVKLDGCLTCRTCANSSCS